MRYKGAAMSEELITACTDAGILTITMNRPEVHNAFDDLQIERFTHALQEAQDNDQVRVVIIAGQGKSFSAGGDINYMRRMGNNTYQENLDDGARLAELMRLLNFLPKPTVARVHGAAMGGGVGLVSCCDYAIGSPRARFALSEVKLGMIPATISPYVVNTIGEKAARRLFMSGQSVDAQQALAMGFLSQVVEEDELDEAIATQAGFLLQNGPHAVGLCKQLAIEVSAGEIDADIISATVRHIADVRDSREGREGLSAFLEKRKPDWIKQ